MKLLSCPQQDRRYEGEIWLYTGEWTQLTSSTERDLEANLTSGSAFSLLRTSSWFYMGPKKDSNKKRSRSQLLLSKMSQHSVWKLWGSTLGVILLLKSICHPREVCEVTATLLGPHLTERSSLPVTASGFLGCRARAQSSPSQWPCRISIGLSRSRTITSNISLSWVPARRRSAFQHTLRIERPDKENTWVK